jgi:hypothetical protein
MFEKRAKQRELFFTAASPMNEKGQASLPGCRCELHPGVGFKGWRAKKQKRAPRTNKKISRRNRLWITG